MQNDAAEMFAQDTRIVRVVRYNDGWVPNSYGWPAPGTADIWTRDPATDKITHTTTRYDRRRSYGRGPVMVGFSARQGRLASV